MERRKTEQWRRPLTVKALAKYGGLDFAPPEGPFDPGDAWELVWQIWLLKPVRRLPNHSGFIRIRRQPETSGFLLSVEQQVINRGSVTVQRAEIHCRNDAFGTPIRWRLEFKLLAFPDLQPVPEARFSKSGLLQEGKIVTQRHGRTFQRPVELPVTTGWGLLEALQRLAKERQQRLGPFTVLDELDKPKPNHTVQFRKNLALPLRGEPVPVHYYQQVGEAWLPWRYYLDGQGRLLVALNGPRAYILNPNTLEIHQRTLNRERSRR